jgi:type III pantothenate kinase
VDHRKVIGVDVGNTSIKAAEFHEREIGEVIRFKDISDVKAHFGSATYIVCSVAKRDVQTVFADCLIVTHSTPLPIKLNYDTPQTLGTDRIAAAVGAWALFPNRNVLVIDSGTCITYDLVTADGVFQGGIISPGLDIRYRAMHEFTESLPRLQSDEPLDFGLLGKSTRECMRIGAEQGLKNEILGFLESFNKKYDRLQVVMTGGYQPDFESNLKAPIFATSKIVLGGLQAIWKFNEGI